MIPVYETAIRAWVEPKKQRKIQRKYPPGFRSIGIGERILVFDTETTTDFTQRLLYGMFSIYAHGVLQHEGVFVGDCIDEKQHKTIEEYCKEHALARYSREAFVDGIFYPEVYTLGTLCVAFNAPFDLSRIACAAGAGRGKNRRTFRLTLSRRVRYPVIRVEAISGRAAFIRFTFKKYPANWERAYFHGRFLDLSTLANALTGRKFTLARAAIAFHTVHRKMRTDELGKVTKKTLTYCRNDVLVTAELYEQLRIEYAAYPFATFANERDMQYGTVPMTRIYSTASVAKATLRLLGFRPLFDGGVQ